MGIYIEGIDMPTNASGCEVIIRTQPDGTVLDEHGIHLYAKAVSVPSYGRLIDADEFYKSLKKWIVGFYSAYEKDKKDEKIAALHDLDLAVRAVLADAPTIIEAEE